MARNGHQLSDGLEDLMETVEEEGIDFSSEAKIAQRRSQIYSEFDDSDRPETVASTELLDRTSDPVRLYLREMGTVPLLTRESEVTIAKRYERGHLRALMAISPSFSSSEHTAL